MERTPDVLLTQFNGNPHIRQRMCDTVIQLEPGNRCIPICSFFLERLPHLQDEIRCAGNNHNTPVSILNYAPASLPAVRCIKIKLPEDEQEVFCYMLECLHLTDSEMAAYVASNVTESGNLVPLLEKASQYHFESLATVCRNEIGIFIRQLLDTGDIRDAFYIVNLFTQSRSANNKDGSFQSRSGVQLRQHPVIRHTMYYLRVVSASIIDRYADDIALMPSIALIYLLIFGGHEHAQKQHHFARIIRERAKKLAASLPPAAQQPRAASYTDWDADILKFQNVESCDTIVSVIETQWARILKPPHRQILRSRSEDGRSRRNYRLAPGFFQPYATTEAGGDSPTVPRRRTESSPTTCLSSFTDQGIAPLNVDALLADSPSIADKMDVVCDPTTTIEPLRASTGVPVMETTRELSALFVLQKTATGNYVSQADQFVPLPESFNHCIDGINGLPPSQGYLSLSLRTSCDNKELHVVAAIPGQRMFQSINSSMFMDIDIDPYVDENSPICEPRSTNLTFYCAESQIIQRYVLKMPQSSRLRWPELPSTFNACIYIKFAF